jgi:hypothetical protein
MWFSKKNCYWELTHSGRTEHVHCILHKVSIFNISIIDLPAIAMLASLLLMTLLITLFLPLYTLLLASMHLPSSMLSLAPILLKVFLLLLALLLASLHHDVLAFAWPERSSSLLKETFYIFPEMSSSLLKETFYIFPCQKSLPVTGVRPFTFSHRGKAWSPWWTLAPLQGQAFPAWRKCWTPGTWRFFRHGGLEKPFWVVRKMFDSQFFLPWYHSVLTESKNKKSFFTVYTAYLPANVLLTYSTSFFSMTILLCLLPIYLLP